MHAWVEIIEDGKHELRRDFEGMILTIKKLDIPGAWACVLPDGKRVVGDLQTVVDTVELIMSSRTAPE